MSKRTSAGSDGMRRSWNGGRTGAALRPDGWLLLTDSEGASVDTILSCVGTPGLLYKEEFRYR